MVSFVSLVDRVVSLDLTVLSVWLGKRLFSMYVYVSRLNTVVFEFRVIFGVVKTSFENIRFLLHLWCNRDFFLLKRAPILKICVIPRGSAAIMLVDFRRFCLPFFYQGRLS